MLPEIGTILYPTGLGPGAPFVFRYVLTLARRHQARISVVFGMEPIKSAGQHVVRTYLSDKQSVEALRQAQERIRADIRKIVEICEADLPPEERENSPVTDISIIDAPPHDAVLQHAEKIGADVIVMGTHRHTVVKGTLLGTTALKVLHGARIPVMMVRIPDGYHDRGI